MPAHKKIDKKIDKKIVKKVVKKVAKKSKSDPCKPRDVPCCSRKLSCKDLPFSITTNQLPFGVNGNDYLGNVAASGNPPATFIEIGSVLEANGLAMDVRGQVTGQIQVPAGVTLPTTIKFTVQATNSCGQTAQKVIGIFVCDPIVPVVTPLSPIAAVQGQAYSNLVTVTATGGCSGSNQALGYQAIGLEGTGLTTNANALTGVFQGTNTSGLVVSGTPTSPGDIKVTFVVTDPTTGQVVTAPAIIQVAAPLAIASPSNTTLISVGNADAPNFTGGTAFSQTFTATGGVAPYTWTINPTPIDTLTMNASTGVLSGTIPALSSPPATASFSFTVTVTDNAAVSVSQLYTFGVESP